MEEQTRQAPPKYITFGAPDGHRPLAQIISREWHDWNAARKRERKRVRRLRIIERDGMVCGICGEAVAAVEDINIDHILPIARGGKSEPENLQVAHSWCNRAKGARFE